MVEMKPSGVQWIGDIPSEWKLGKVKNRFYSTKTIVGDKVDDYERLALTLGGVIKRSKEANDGLQPEKFDGYQILEENELVFKLIDLANVATSRVGLSPYTGIVSPAYIVLHDKQNGCPRYAEYYFLSMWMHEVFNHLGGDGVRSSLNAKDLLNVPFPLISETEQQAIADYLDDRCSKIDEIIAEATASIEEYKELKQAVIFEAVTKGLDKNVPMKPSSIKGVMQIPEHWSVTRLKYLVSMIESGVSVNAGSEPAKDGEFGVLKTSSVSKMIFLPEENKNVNSDEYKRVKCPVKRNTIIVSRMNTPELVGACGYVDKDYDTLFLPDRLWQVHFISGINVKYIYYCLSSSYIRDYYASLATGTSSSMQNISQGQFLAALIPTPSLHEQENVVFFLDTLIPEYDALISEKQALIDDLQVYKKSLIYEVVTGKRRVV